MFQVSCILTRWGFSFFKECWAFWPLLFSGHSFCFRCPFSFQTKNPSLTTTFSVNNSLHYPDLYPKPLSSQTHEHSPDGWTMDGFMSLLSILARLYFYLANFNFLPIKGCIFQTILPYSFQLMEVLKDPRGQEEREVRVFTALPNYFKKGISNLKKTITTSRSEGGNRDNSVTKTRLNPFDQKE